MIAELHKCPAIYAPCKDCVVMAKMTPDGERLVVVNAAADGKTWLTEHDEAALTPIKGSHDWPGFFAELQSAFAQDKVVANAGSIEVKCGDGSKINFKLDTSREDGQKLVFDAVLNYHHVRIHNKEVEKQLEETVKREQEVLQNAQELEKEESALKDLIQRSKESEEVNGKRIIELQAEIDRVEKEKREAGAAEEVVEEEDEDLLICRARLPLGHKVAKDYDKELFKLVKSKWVPDTESDNNYNNVIRPYTTSELEMQTKNFSSKQREVIWECLKKIDEWDFDVFTLQAQMSGDDHDSLCVQPNGGSLLVTSYALLFRHQIMQKFSLDENILMNWCSVVEAGYHGNPYHNSMHAADVLHITHYILNNGGLIAKCKLTDEDIFAALFAATIHDYDHPGINNNFHIKAGTYLATLYNDRSILENRHVSSVFELMKLPKYNILANLTEDQKRDIRDTVVEMVLATDMGLHAKILSQFKRRLQENHDFTKKEDIRLALSMSVKMADISNCGRPENLYLRWCAKIADEFYMQGDRERKLGMPCSPFMDRTQPAMAKGQIAFMNYIVVPLFECISEFLPDMHFSVDYTDNNKSYWTSHDDS